mgnify:FL=1
MATTRQSTYEKGIATRNGSGGATGMRRQLQHQPITGYDVGLIIGLAGYATLFVRGLLLS